MAAVLGTGALLGSAAIGAAGSLLGGMIGSSGQAAANRMNYKIWREQRDWQTQMSNSEISRRVQDMRNAGINPMMAVNGGGAASSPVVGGPRMENTRAPMAAAIAQAADIAANARLKIASAKAAEAQARSTNVDAQLKSAELPYSAGNAAIRARQLDINLRETQEKVEHLLKDNEIRELEKWQLERLQPLILELQSIENERARLNLPESRAMAEFWRSEYGRKIAPYVKTGSEIVGTAVGAARTLKQLGSSVGKKQLGSGVGKFFRR